MIKKYTTSGIFYKVYHQPTAREFYFEWRPTVANLKQLCYLQDIYDIEEFLKSDFEITKIEAEDSYSYNIKLRLK